MDDNDSYTIEVVRGDDANVTRYNIVEKEAIPSSKAPEERSTYEQIEHVCGGCGKVYKNVTCLKKHFSICSTGKTFKQTKKRHLKSPTEDTPKENKRARRHKTIEIIPEDPTEPDTSTIELISEENEDGDVKEGNFQIQILNDLDEESCHCCDEPLSKAHRGHVECSHCKKKFHTYVGREKHLMNIHSSCELFKCTKCPAQCPDALTLERHLVNHPEFVCMKCAKEFTRLYHLERHFEKSECSLDNPDTKKTSCNVCGKKFLRLDNLREHLRSHIGANFRKRDHPCEICGKAFYGLSMLQIHIRTHTNEKPFSCDLCEKAFPSNGALRKHRRVHTGEKPYACTYCEGTFAAKETLNRHMKTHTGEKNHKCAFCEKAFIQKTQLRNHLRIHHDAKGIQCPHCSETFETNIVFKKHIVQVHKLEHACSKCEEVFPTEDSLNRHYGLKHSNEVFFCGDCCMNFDSKEALYEHNTTNHSFPKRPTCEICGKVYKMQVALQQHIEREHSDLPDGSGPHTPPPKRKVGRPRKSDTADKPATEKKPSPNRNAKLFKDRWDFSSFTENVPLKMPKIDYSTETELTKPISDIISGMLNKETHKRLNWPTCGVEGALENLLQLVKVSKINQEHSGTVRNSTMALLGRFIGKRSLTNLKNNYTVDEIIYYWASSVSKISSGVTKQSAV